MLIFNFFFLDPVLETFWRLPLRLCSLFDLDCPEFDSSESVRILTDFRTSLQTTFSFSHLLMPPDPISSIHQSTCLPLGVCGSSETHQFFLFLRRLSLFAVPSSSKPEFAFINVISRMLQISWPSRYALTDFCAPLGTASVSSQRRMCRSPMHLSRHLTCLSLGVCDFS